MAVPKLRLPKFITERQEILKKEMKSSLADAQNVIITLNDNRKLVVSSDAYHGVITAGGSYKCVLCDMEMELDSFCKDNHKKSADHKKMLELCPHIARYSENLVRELSKESSFCTICNVVISNMYLMRHITTQAHVQEIEKAFNRADTYKPS